MKLDKNLIKQGYKVVPQLLLIQDNKVLLLLRENTGQMDGFWCGVTGKIEPGESPSATLIREASEEVGIIVQDVLFSNCVEHKSPNYFDPHGLYLGIELIFVATQWSSNPYNKEPHKHAEVKWFDINVIPEKIIPSLGAGIKNYQKGITYSEENLLGKVSQV